MGKSPFFVDNYVENRGNFQSTPFTILKQAVFLFTGILRELDKLMIHTLADVALKRKAKGLKLNHPETVAVLSAAALEEARAGKTVEEVMAETRKVLTRNDVMEGVVEMIPTVQVEAVFTDGSRLITIHNPIN